jgi:hypothetical protein
MHATHLLLLCQIGKHANQLWIFASSLNLIAGTGTSVMQKMRWGLWDSGIFVVFSFPLSRMLSEAVNINTPEL